MTREVLLSKLKKIFNAGDKINKKNYEEQVEPTMIVGLIEKLGDFKLALEEYVFETEFEGGERVIEIVEDAIKKAKNGKLDNLNKEQYAKWVIQVSGKLEKHIEGIKNLGRTVNNRIKNGYFRTQDVDVDSISRLINKAKRNINILDVGCGEGDAIHRLGKNIKGEDEEGNPVTVYDYGIEVDEYRASKAKQLLYRVAKGDFRGCRIKHNAFDIIWCNPPYDNNINTDKENISGKSLIRSEKMFLQNITNRKWLRPNGILIYIIPYYRLTLDICFLLSKYYKNFTIGKYGKEEFKKFKQIAIIAYKKEKPMQDDDMMYELFSYSTDHNKIPLLTELPNNIYEIVNKEHIEIDPKEFRGAFKDYDDMYAIAKSHNMMGDFIQEVKAKNSSFKIRQSTTELKAGFIALLGATGGVNGIVPLIDEENREDKTILFKGVSVPFEVYRDVEMSEGKNDIGKALSVTRLNKIQYLAFNKEGEYFKL